eukprot:CAMPEP_0184379816 /NCGR_PEP_ID=MMETSP0007-20130409/4194_1 /TAXON_ID=97485 /ORGANISM="Prymnesium parvum, Strain Texoma1" /LENGTH=73 /DNA_ID=CAMNT_0026724715 /DNA_START=10 /DNA_END=231 /DNA_ORIENTATION=-
MSACVDCQDAKAEAEAKAAATRPQDDGLNLGDCAPLYREWADCIEREGVGTGAKACMKVLKEFRSCHEKLQKR